MASVHHKVSLILEFYKVQFSESAVLIYINDVTENLQSNPKFFVGDNILLTIIIYPNATA